MCSLCGGSLCSGTGACNIVVRHAPEVIKISYSSVGNHISFLQSCILTVFVTTKDSLLKSIKYIKNKYEIS